MRNIKLTLRYDGTAYCGWQRQNNGISVQQKIEEAIEEITGAYSFLEGCGRTDAGVHALCYTANFLSDTKIPSKKLHFAINTKLPDDIRVMHAEDAEETFHSRFSAVKKTYRYEISTDCIFDPFLINRVWNFPFELDFDKMKEQASSFVGEHDFLGFMSAGGQVKTTVRTIYSAELFRENGKIIFEVTGNGFLYNMVRIMAGTLVSIGSGKITEKLSDIIASKDRSRAGITAPPQGLYLKKVYYGEQ